MNDETPQPSRLTPEQLAQVTGDIAAHGEARDKDIEEHGMPSALTPAKIEELMKRTIMDKDIKEMCHFVRPADAEKDPGEHDLTPLANVVAQVSRKGPVAFSITVMFAAWALATFSRLAENAKFDDIYQPQPKKEEGEA